MPDRKKLKIGDKIRLLKVPEEDKVQREQEIAQGVEEPGWTADTIERIIAQDPVVEVYTIDDFERPWFTCDIMVNGELETHTLAINEDDSWEMV
ncbi:hypothetical protein [Flavilitoribacter nigricans]|uniref:Uncharacterized protein n=1 Tax=Flavilitoribacter nigricans (strain ATCC 23147 / DSM 23189 / NBRC 102662 / NCIMB 1420 / SS-2) TaxID=1122177 RepID=A0A2D0NGT7_FLAN2|nr:hypothetical protein [Flavilitoribacter nigricans]PHN06973.1 hypothetical protein CRP01_08410 [Flavilitoribacter nigricans DSM 23189 = NBRC 102662]